MYLISFILFLLQRPRVTIEVIEYNDTRDADDEEFTIVRPRASLRLSIGNFSIGSLMPGTSSISFHDISYEVKKLNCFKKRPNKVILKSVRYR